MSSSTIPAALLALVDRAETALADGIADETISVHDGPPVVQPAQIYLTIGHSPVAETDDAVVDWRQASAAIGAQSREEGYGIACYLGTNDGSYGDMRARLFAALALLEADLREHGDLNGTVRFAELNAAGFMQGTDEDGVPGAGIDFRITVQARI